MEHNSMMEVKIAGESVLFKAGLGVAFHALFNIHCDRGFNSPFHCVGTRCLRGIYMIHVGGATDR